METTSHTSFHHIAATSKEIFDNRTHVFKLPVTEMFFVGSPSETCFIEIDRFIREENGLGNHLR